MSPRPARTGGAPRVVRIAAAVLVLGAVGAVAALRLSPYLAAALIIAAALAPFLAEFERRRPTARDVALLAVLVALAVASRAAFALVPHFKPMAAVVMITGVALGARSGFLVGALAALVSGFLFGQGPWTPFQMLAFGTAGLAFGLIADRGLIPRDRLAPAIVAGLALGGFIFVVLVAGPILDTSSVFLMLSTLTPEGVAAIYLAGLPVNAIHGAATALTLLLAANPLLAQIARVRAKYGME